MGFREFLQTLERNGLRLEEHQIRSAIKRRRISRPELDPSLRFVFEKKHVDECRKIFARQAGKA